jgi:hypothetical protein
MVSGAIELATMVLVVVVVSWILGLGQNKRIAPKAQDSNI